VLSFCISSQHKGYIPIHFLFVCVLSLFDYYCKMKSVLLVTLLLVALQASLVFSDPCDVNLSQIKSAMAEANTFRQACEKSFFSSGACDSYWSKVNQVLGLQIDYQDCGRQTSDKFQSDVRSSIQTQGDTTRTQVTTSATSTQGVVSSQASTTRDFTTQENNRAINAINTLTSQENTNTRTTVSNEATSTRNLINAQHATTNTFVSNNASTIIATTITEATNTRTTVNNQHDQSRTTLTNVIQTEGASTRRTVQTEANATRIHQTFEQDTTRAHVSTEAQTTRAWTTTEATSTRNNNTAESAATRTTVSNENTATRASVDAAAQAIMLNNTAESTITRSTVSFEASNTRINVSAEAANTNTLVSNSFATNTASLQALQTQQSNFTTLFITVMIQMDFSASSSRCDLFQRPAAKGGYFETMRQVVLDTINTNTQLYGSSRVGNSIANWNVAETYKGNGDYRRAWESYRNAYMAATSNNNFF